MMTEVMVHSLLDESFPFTGSKFNHIKSSSEAEMSKIENSVLEDSYNEQTDTMCDKSSDSTICESDTDDSMVSTEHVPEIKVSESVGNSSNNLVQTENISDKDYKILATKTTVINTTYNLITQSTRKIMNLTTGVERTPWSSFPNVMTESVDKSRVIVQVLKSDLKSKSQNVIEAKSTSAENQSTHSFRDDLCKLLSKSQSSKFDEGKNIQAFPIKDPLDVSDTFQNVSSESQDAKPRIVKVRRKRNLKFYFRNGNGKKIRDLKCVCDNIRQANPASLRYLHYVMFNIFGLCGTGHQLLETKRNISGFCGYPFKRSSEQFQKKLQCLQKIPIELLNGIHRAIFGRTSFRSDRSIMIDQLIDFLWIPRKCSDILKRYESKLKFMSEEEYAALKESALKGPNLSVMLQKLPEDHMKKLTSDYVLDKCETTANQSTDENAKMEIESSHTIPAFILNGPGSKLKCFPKIANNVQTVDEQHIKMLHFILYGRIEPDIKDCRRNILEFNGFSDCQQEFAAERKAIIMGLNQKELFGLCQILCLRGKTNSRDMRIMKILKYLQSPTKPVTRRAVWLKRSGHLEGHLSNRSSYKNVSKRKKNPIFKSPKSNLGVPNHIVTSPSISSDEVCSDSIFGDGWKLRDFRTICSNIECAVPSNLIALNDLLFLKPCDESDIHQKILDFTRFKFSSSSVHYDARKTLMHYMGFCVARKIAHLLDIKNWKDSSNADDLSTNILKFLMEKKGPDSPHSKSSPAKSKFESSSVVKSSSPTKSMFESSSVVKSSSPTKLMFDSSSVVKSSSPTKSMFESNSVVKSSLPAKSMFESTSVVKSSLPAKSVCENNCVVNSSLPSFGLPSPKAVLKNSCSVNPDNPKRFKSEFFQQTNQAVTHHKGKVIIQRLTKASIQTERMCQSRESGNNKSDQMNVESFEPDLPYFNSAEDDSTLLRDLIHHPTEQELKDLIYHLVKENMWHYTVGEIVQKVYECYPKVNLTYQENFIKGVVRQMLSELRDYAVHAVKDQTF